MTGRGSISGFKLRVAFFKRGLIPGQKHGYIALGGSACRDRRMLDSMALGGDSETRASGQAD